ncbi:MAG: WhiB family transcriptional regulator [Ilumatobacteraceae bacterium]
MAVRREEEDDDLRWQQSAACRGENAAMFYPPPFFERKDLRVARESLAKSVCASCPVKQSCLGHALRTAEPHGIWGGLNEAERKGLRQRAC